MTLEQVIATVQKAVAEQIIFAADLQAEGIVACVFLDKDGHAFSCQLAEGIVFPGEKDGHLLRCIEIPVRDIEPLALCTPEDILKSGKGVVSTTDVITATWYLLQSPNLDSQKTLLRTLFPAIWKEAEKVKANEAAALYLLIPEVKDKIKAFLA